MFSSEIFRPVEYKNHFQIANFISIYMIIIILVIILITYSVTIIATKVLAANTGPTMNPASPSVPPAPYFRTVHVEKIVLPGLDGVSEAKCSSGESVTGGGFWIRPDLNGHIVDNLKIEILGSRPSETGQGWSVWLHNFGDKASYITFAQCANLPVGK